MFNRVTMDGYFAGPDGNLNWVVPEEELDRGAAEGLTGASRRRAFPPAASSAASSTTSSNRRCRGDHSWQRS